MKYKIKTKDCYLNVSVRAGLGENFDEHAMNAFARASLRSFMKPETISRKRIDFSGPIGVSLYERLQRPMDKRFFLCILEHIVIAAEKIRSSNLVQDNVVLDLHYVYINEQTKELRFLYVPSDKPQEHVDFSRFVEMVVYSVKPEGADPEFIYRFNNFLKTAGRFEPAKIEKFVSQEDKTVVTALKKQYTGMSGYMTDKPKHYYDHYESNNSSNQEDETSVLQEQDEDATSLLTSNYGGDSDATGLLYEFDGEQTGILQDSFDETGLLTEYDDTALLEAEEGTCLLQEEKSYCGYLHRANTGETIRIQSAVFRLGKGAVDYVINNPVVSRRHAEIVDRDGRFFVIDLDSKNHTYINDEIIPSGYEMEIQNGDRLKLANEEFVFRVE